MKVNFETYFYNNLIIHINSILYSMYGMNYKLRFPSYYCRFDP